MRLCCYLCRQPVARGDIAGTADFTFGTYPICKTCVDGEEA